MYPAPLLIRRRSIGYGPLDRNTSPPFPGPLQVYSEAAISNAQPKILDTRNMRRIHSLTYTLPLLCGMALTACSSIPTSGPSTSAVTQAPANPARSAFRWSTSTTTWPGACSPATGRRFFENARRTRDDVTAVGRRRRHRGVDLGGSACFAVRHVVDGRAPQHHLNARVTALPDQTIDSNGNVRIPFVGPIRAAGRTPEELGMAITERLKGKANQPQTLVRLVQNTTSYVTIVGDVNSSKRMPLTPSGERILTRSPARAACGSRSKNDAAGYARQNRAIAAAGNDHPRSAPERSASARRRRDGAVSAEQLHGARRDRQERGNQLRSAGHYAGPGARPHGRSERLALRRCASSSSGSRRRMRSNGRSSRSRRHPTAWFRSFIEST